MRGVLLWEPYIKRQKTCSTFNESKAHGVKMTQITLDLHFVKKGVNVMQ